MNDTHKIEFAGTIFLATAALVFLFFIISPSLCAVEGKYSISGYVFNDANGNGEWNKAEENGLENWIVYIDRDNNFRRDAGEEYSNTNETGYYSISDLENVTYRVREELQAHWTQTSVPKSFEISIEKAASKDNNFGNVESKLVLINPDQVWWLFWIYLIGAAISLISGLVLFILGLKNCKCNTSNAIKDNMESIAKVVAGIILILLGVHLLGNLEDISGIGLHLEVNQLPMWALLLIVVILFAGLLGIGICKPEQMESGQMRRAIAGLLVFGFVAILVFSLYGKLPIENKEIVSQYIQLVGIIIGFYFGAKITSDAAGMKSEISPTKSNESKIDIGDLDKTKMPYEISIENLGKDPVMVARIDLEDTENFKNIYSFNPDKFFIKGLAKEPIQLPDLDKKLDPMTKNLSIKIWTSIDVYKVKEVKLQK
jgi:hypothetical protein